MSSSAYDLYKTLFSGSGTLLEGAKRLLIVPDGALIGLPFSVLITTISRARRRLARVEPALRVSYSSPRPRFGCLCFALPLAVFAAMGIRDHPTAARSPWQNGHAERLIGSIRRECLDLVVVFSDAHLRRILAAYTGYYNELRTHLSLDKDSQGHRPIQRLGQLAARPILGGLHHQYCRM